MSNRVAGRRQPRRLIHVSGTGKWREPGVPHRGWSCIGIEDLGEPDHVCEMCEVMPVRYIHAMEHPEYDDVLNVGCVCAGNMEQDYEGARQRERDFKKRQSRRKRWILREWRVSMSGNEFINTDGFNIVVFARGSSWSARGQASRQRAAAVLAVALPDRRCSEARRLRCRDRIACQQEKTSEPTPATARQQDGGREPVLPLARQ